MTYFVQFFLMCPKAFSSALSFAFLLTPIFYVTCVLFCCRAVFSFSLVLEEFVEFLFGVFRSDDYDFVGLFEFDVVPGLECFLWFDD